MATIGNLIVKIGADTSDLETGISKAQGKLRSAGDAMMGMGAGLTAAVTVPILGIAGAALKSAGDFEQAMNQMQVISGATGEQMKTMQAEALKLGAETSFSAGEAAQAMLELSKAGLNAEQTIQAVPGVLDLAAAGNLGLAQAAEIASNAVNAFKLPADQASTVANMLAAAANASSVEVTDLAQAFSASSAVFASNNQSIGDLTTALALLGNNAMKGSDAGTSMKTMMMRLAAPTEEAGALMQSLGITVYDAQGAMLPFPKILESMQKALIDVGPHTKNMTGLTKEQSGELKHYQTVIEHTQQKLHDYATGVAGANQTDKARSKSIAALQTQLAAAQQQYAQLNTTYGQGEVRMRALTQEERNQVLQTIFGSDAIRAANILLAQGTDKWNEMSAAVNKQGAAAEVAGARMKGFNGAIEYIKGSIDSFLIGAALPFLDMIGDGIRYVADLITSVGNLPQPVLMTALAFAAGAAALGPLLIVMGMLLNATAGLLPVFAALTGPVGLAVAALAALAYLNFDNIKAFVADVLERITLVAPYAGTVLHDVWAVLTGIGRDANTSTDSLYAFVTVLTGSPAVAAVVAGAVERLGVLFREELPAALATAQAWFGVAWSAAQGYVGAAWAMMGPVLTQMIGWLQTNIPVGLATVQAWFNTAWSTASGYVGAAWAMMGPMLTQIVGWLQTNIPVGLATAQAWFGVAWSAASGYVGAAWANMGPMLGQLIAWFTVNIPAGLATLQAWFSATWGTISGAVGTAWGVIQPPLMQLWTWLSLLAQNFMALDGPNKLFVAGLETLGVLLPIIAGAGGIGAVTAALGALLSPVGSVSAAAVLLGVAWTSNWGGIRDITAAVWAVVQPIFERLVASVLNFVQQMTTLGPSFQALWNAAQPVLMALGQVIGVVLVFAVNLLASTFNNLAPVVKAVIDQATAILNLLVNTVTNVIALVTALIHGDWAGAWTAAQNLIGGFVTYAQSTFGNLWVVITAIFATIGSTIRDTLADLGFAGAAAAVQTVIDKITSLVAWLGDLATGKVSLNFNAPAWIETLTSWVWPAMGEAAAWVTGLVAWAWPKLGDAAAWVTSLLAWAWPALNPAEWVTKLTSWNWPTLSEATWVTKLTSWSWPTLNPVDWVTKLTSWSWPTLSMPDWLTKLPGMGTVSSWFGGGEGDKQAVQTTQAAAAQTATQVSATTLDWSTVIPSKLDWSAFITSKLDWSAYIPAKLDWSVVIPTKLEWSIVIPSKLDWSAFITSKLDWSAFITSKLEWTSFITSKLTWSTFVNHISWGDFVASLSWDDFIQGVNLSDYTHGSGGSSSGGNDSASTGDGGYDGDPTTRFSRPFGAAAATGGVTVNLTGDITINNGTDLAAFKQVLVRAVLDAIRRGSNK